jgi:alpha-tubulin suppressor-like RCC1 family protein
MEHIQRNIYALFALKHYLQSIIGHHAPYEIIHHIIMMIYPKMEIACGEFHVALLVDSDIYTWGLNNDGQLGLKYTRNRSSPEKVNLSHIEKVKCGSHYTLALNKFGEIFSWGANHRGQLGFENETRTERLYWIPRKCSPQKIDLENIIDISCGSYFGMALNVLGEIYSWGDNTYGQLGLGHRQRTVYTPEKINLEGVVSISCGYYSSMAVTQTGDIYVWGANFSFQLGLIDVQVFDGIDLPHKISLDNICCHIDYPINPSNIRTIYHSDECSMLVTKDDQLYSCGHNDGRLGFQTDPDVLLYEVWTKIDIDNIDVIVCGTGSSMAMSKDNKIWVWGDNTKGQLGLNHDENQCLPCQLDLPNIKTFSLGYRTVVAISIFGEIWTWGYNNFGVLGQTNQSSRPLKLCPTIKYDWSPPAKNPPRKRKTNPFTKPKRKKVKYNQ